MVVYIYGVPIGCIPRIAACYNIFCWRNEIVSYINLHWPLRPTRAMPGQIWEAVEGSSIGMTTLTKLLTMYKTLCTHVPDNPKPYFPAPGPWTPLFTHIAHLSYYMWSQILAHSKLFWLHEIKKVCCATCNTKFPRCFVFLLHVLQQVMFLLLNVIFCLIYLYYM